MLHAQCSPSANGSSPPPFLQRRLQVEKHHAQGFRQLGRVAVANTTPAALSLFLRGANSCPLTSLAHASAARNCKSTQDMYCCKLQTSQQARLISLFKTLKSNHQKDFGARPCLALCDQKGGGSLRSWSPAPRNSQEQHEEKRAHDAAQALMRLRQPHKVVDVGHEDGLIPATHEIGQPAYHGHQSAPPIGGRSHPRSAHAIEEDFQGVSGPARLIAPIGGPDSYQAMSSRDVPGYGNVGTQKV